jgi:hypothetical protein
MLAEKIRTFAGRRRVLIRVVCAAMLSAGWVPTVTLLSVWAQAESKQEETPAQPIPVSSGPHIVFAEPIYDFGTVEQGEKVMHLFRFTNKGQQDLRIERVKTTCGCTAVVLSVDLIKPGEEGTVSTTFDTTRYTGEKVRTVTVYSNDPVHPVTTLTLQGEITQDITAEPTQLYLGRVRRGEEVTRTVEIFYNAEKPVTIVKVENTNPAVYVRVEEIRGEKRRGKKLIVTLTKKAPLGRLNDQITVTTTSEKQPVLNIPVFGSVEGDMLVLPPQVSFGVLRSGQDKAQEVRIKNRAAKPVHILRVESSTTAVAPEFSAIEDGQEYRLVLKAKGGTEPGRLRGEIRVFTDHPQEKILTIPLYGMISGA